MLSQELPPRVHQLLPDTPSLSKSVLSSRRSFSSPTQCSTSFTIALQLAIPLLFTLNHTWPRGIYEGVVWCPVWRARMRYYCITYLVNYSIAIVYRRIAIVYRLSSHRHRLSSHRHRLSSIVASSSSIVASSSSIGASSSSIGASSSSHRHRRVARPPGPP